MPEKESKSYENWLKVLAEMPEKLPMVDGYGYKYTPLSTILNTVRSILTKHGFAISQDWDYDPEKNTVKIATSIYDKNSLFLGTVSHLPALVINKGNAVQGVGATITYGRRYQVSALLGIATEEDTDAKGGETANKVDKKKEEKPVNDKLKTMLNNTWKKVKEAHEMGVLSDDVAMAQRKALKNITTETGAKAIDKAIDRLISRELDKRDVKVKEDGGESTPEVVDDKVTTEEQKLFESEEEGVQWMN